MERDEKILELHNEGNSVRQISDELKVSKSLVHKVLSTILEKPDVMPKIPTKVKLTGNEERFTNFGSYVRTNVNEYCHKDSGEIIHIAFIPAKKKGDYGYFVKLD